MSVHYSLDLVGIMPTAHVERVERPTDRAPYVTVKRLCSRKVPRVVAAAEAPHCDLGEVVLAMSGPNACDICLREWEEVAGRG